MKIIYFIINQILVTIILVPFVISVGNAFGINLDNINLSIIILIAISVIIIEIIIWLNNKIYLK